MLLGSKTWIISFAAVVALALACAVAAGTAPDWGGSLAPGDLGGGLTFGACPGWGDGYDGQALFDISKACVHMRFFRENGASWAGPTGFYTTDYESPIPPGGSKTWWRIRLWAYNYTPIFGDRVRTVYVADDPAPVGWWGRLVLDYSPAHLNWTGPAEWWFPLQRDVSPNLATLPCPITDDPYNPDNVTRLHLEVYTYPIPEPSSVAALGFALAGVGIGVVRRRR